VPNGWHYGDGVPPSQAVVGLALDLQVHAAIIGLMETDAFLGTNGEVRVTIYVHQIYLEFTVEPDGTISFVREDRGIETNYRPAISIDEARSILSDTGRELWASYGFSTTGTTTTGADVFSLLYSETHRTAPEYL